MDGDRFLMAAGISAAVVVGAFVIWGPSGSSRLRQRRGQIAGLHNFGKTCFLNTLLQALAACPQFIAWLQLHHTKDKKSLISALQNCLEVVNGTHPTLRGDPYSPGAVIRALGALGWVIPADEHDTHELLHVLLTSLEEEATKPKKLGCLSDALGDGDLTPMATLLPQRPSSAMMSDFTNSDYDESTSLTRFTRSEAHTPDSPHSTCTEQNEDNSYDNSMLEGTSPPTIVSSLGTMTLGRVSRPRAMTHDMTGSLNKRSSGSCRSLERLSRGPGRVSIWSEPPKQIQVPHPFRGSLSSQLICNGCGHKSVVRYDKFDSITLSLPEHKNPGLSLGNLLSEFVASETLQGYTCESCNESTTHEKTVTFGKLPACLCIHISRTTWLPTGVAFKRQDFVHFPESLSMAPYSFVQPSLGSNMSTPWGSTMSLYSASLGGGAFGGEPDFTVGSGSYNFGSYTFGAMFPKNLYRLLAVIVHSGEAHSGHFVTYRRGALRNAHKWFYTSDHIVREVTIEEVLSVPAYMLFYDRGPSSKYTASGAN